MYKPDKSDLRRRPAMTRRVVFLPRPRNVDLIALIGEAIITAAFFFALGFALVIIAALCAAPVGV